MRVCAYAQSSLRLLLPEMVSKTNINVNLIEVTFECIIYFAFCQVLSLSVSEFAVFMSRNKKDCHLSVFNFL